MKAIRILLAVFCFISLTEKLIAQENTVTSGTMPAAVSASDEDFRAVMKAIRKERNQKKLRIGIITQGMIGAHFVMATAIKEGLEAEFGEQFEVEICDDIPNEMQNKYYKIIETKSGIKKVDIQQRIISFISRFININKISLLLPKFILNQFISRENIDKIISKEFDVIISTAHLIHNLISYMPKVIQRRPIIISVPNDVDYYRRDYIDLPNILYCIYLNKQQELLKKFGCPHFKRISGALIRKEFHDIRKMSKADAKQQLGFNPDEPVIMASFGSAGNEEVFEIANFLKDKQCILMCSKNEALKKRIEDLGNPKHRVERFLNAEDMANRMRAADVFIGKGGNSTIWEAIQCESIFLPLKEFIYLLEEENVKFLVENNLGKEVKKTKDLPRIVEEVLADPAYSTYKRALAGIQNNAVQEMVKVVKDVADNYEEWQDKLWGKKRIIFYKMFESGGHHETVKAIKNELQKEKWAKNWDIEEFNLSSSVLGRIGEFIYTKIVCFWFPKSVEVIDWIHVSFRKIGINIFNLFNKNDYPFKHNDLIVICAPFINEDFLEFLKKRSIKNPMLQVVTDFDDTIEYKWITSKQIFYLLGTNYLLENAKAKDIPNVIPTSGMVIRREFSEIRRNSSKAEAKMKLGFNSAEPVICICYGSAGNRRINQLAKMLEDRNAIFICGNHFQPKKNLEQIANPKHKIMGYVDTNTMATCLRASEIVIGKPGPGVVSEAWECECVPICEGGDMVMSQEKPIEKDIDKNKRGIIVEKFEDISAAIETILTDPTYKNNCSAVQNNALQQVCEVIGDVANSYDWWRERMWRNAV